MSKTLHLFYGVSYRVCFYLIGMVIVGQPVTFDATFGAGLLQAEASSFVPKGHELRGTLK